MKRTSGWWRMRVRKSIKSRAKLCAEGEKSEEFNSAYHLSALIAVTKSLTRGFYFTVWHQDSTAHDYITFARLALLSALVGWNPPNSCSCCYMKGPLLLTAASFHSKVFLNTQEKLLHSPVSCQKVLFNWVLLRRDLRPSQRDTFYVKEVHLCESAKIMTLYFYSTAFNSFSHQLT